ncbi:AI-2E family transporter [Botryobacter ruber]|uniref:AI-2E family transporter n=1 Tax=Botryobacter ruber TaxID=2171629 RepID=UPI000E0BC6F1|nr:AI-2E family transporter [Botryobacter ruber]
MTDNYAFAKRTALAALVLLLVGTAFYLVGKHLYFFLLVFAGILLAVLFCGMTDLLTGKLHMKRWLALTLSILFFFGVLIGSVWLVAPTVADQADQMKEALPRSLTKVQDWLAQQSWGKRLAEKLPQNFSSSFSKRDDIVSRLTGAFSTTLSFIADLFVVIITAIFFSSNPKLYTHGFVKLFGVQHRTRILEVLQKCYETLRMWLVGMLASMAIIGVSTAIAYNLIGLPMAFALALIAFLFSFIPNIGPYIAAVPAVLVGLLEGPQMALTVILVYGGIQMVESWVITPIIFQKTVDLPPALLLFFQVLLGILQGALGLLLAAPILAVLMVVINELYVKDTLEKRGQNPTAPATTATAPDPDTSAPKA